MKSTYIAAAIVLLIGVLAIEGLVYILVLGLPAITPVATQEKPNLELTIVAGELGDKYGFGLSKESVSSPGPEIKVREREIVQVVFRNSGKVSHTLRITNEVKWDSPALFGVHIGEPTRPISPGQEGTATFKADKRGSYFYICNVPGHAEFGMFGKITIEAKG